MRVSIIAPDQVVVVDGGALVITMVLELLTQDIHAVQWYGDFGEIEFATHWLPDEQRFDRKPNERITDFSEFQKYVDRWHQAKDTLMFTWTPNEAGLGRFPVKPE
jgi:hypothetical protein